MHIFEEVLFFNLRTNSEFNLSYVSWMWEAGGRKRAWDWLALFLLLVSHIKLTQVELNVCFSVFLLYEAWKRGLPWKCARFVLFCPIKKRPFNLLRALDLYINQSQLSCERPWLHQLGLLKQLCYLKTDLHASKHKIHPPVEAVSQETGALNSWTLSDKSD